MMRALMVVTGVALVIGLVSWVAMRRHMNKVRSRRTVKTREEVLAERVQAATDLFVALLNSNSAVNLEDMNILTLKARTHIKLWLETTDESGVLHRDYLTNGTTAPPT